MPFEEEPAAKKGQNFQSKKQNQQHTSSLSMRPYYHPIIVAFSHHYYFRGRNKQQRFLVTIRENKTPRSRFISAFITLILFALM